jgi:hypothetical protein
VRINNSLVDCRQVLGVIALSVVFLAPAGSVSAAPLFPATLSENTTGFADAIFTGAPDDMVEGLSTNYVTYDFGLFRVNNRAGVDINVYEFDTFTAEFGFMNVLVSANGVNFVSIKSTETTLVNITGDGAHGLNTFGRSYDLTPSGITDVRYVRVQGTGTNNTPCCLRVGFDLDAIGAHDVIAAPTAIPEPSTLALFGGGAVLTALKRRRARSRQ